MLWPVLASAHTLPHPRNAGSENQDRAAGLQSPGELSHRAQRQHTHRRAGAWGCGLTAPFCLYQICLCSLILFSSMQQPTGRHETPRGGDSWCRMLRVCLLPNVPSLPQAGSQQGPRPVCSQGNRDRSHGRAEARVSLCSSPTMENASLCRAGLGPCPGLLNQQPLCAVHYRPWCLPGYKMGGRP